MSVSEELLPGCVEVAASPPGLPGGRHFTAYVISGYTTPSYRELVTCTAATIPNSSLHHLNHLFVHERTSKEPVTVYQSDPRPCQSSDS